MSIQKVDQDALRKYWKVTDNGMDNIKQASSVLSSRHGLLSSVPLICRGNRCPFSETCPISIDKREVGARCPVEIAAMTKRFEDYCQSLGVTENDAVDLGLIKELVDIEVQMIRADNKMAMSPDFIEEFVCAVDPRTGTQFFQTKLSPVIDYKERLRRERHRILQLLASTRKDRMMMNKSSADPSTQAAQLIERLREMEKNGQIRHVIEIRDQVESDSAEPDTGKTS